MVVLQTKNIIDTMRIRILCKPYKRVISHLPHIQLMIQVLECTIGNSHKLVFQCDPALRDYLHLQPKPSPGSGEWFGYFRDDKFRSVEKCIHFSG